MKNETQEFNQSDMDDDTDLNKLFHATTASWMTVEKLVDWDFCEHHALESDCCLAMLLLKRAVYISHMFCEMNALDKKIHLAQIEMAFCTFCDACVFYETKMWKNFGAAIDAIDVLEKNLKLIKNRNFDKT